MHPTKIRQRLAEFIQPKKNSMGQDLAGNFMRYGNKKALMPDWSQIVMSDKDMYTGFPYGAINDRATAVVELATNNLITNASDKLTQEAKTKEAGIVHPYLELIDESLDFTNESFWYEASTYLDLEGVHYILAVRNVASGRVGSVQSFKLLSPYEVRRIRNAETLEIGGYVETRDGLVRELPPQMIIDIRKMNPFSRDDPFALSDALKDSQYTLKQAGDYTKHSLKNNMAAPGIISTDVLLEPTQFQNFVARVTNQEKGLPLFGNGAGAITWDSMQIDMDKVGLDKINEININGISAVSGVSKTMFGIEQSGVTRDSSKVQKDLFITNHAMPQLQLIIGALNQDYKKYYSDEYKTTRYRMTVDNPLGSDKEAELKEVEIKTKSFDLFDSLVSKGYDPKLASKYCEGKITLEELGKPTPPKPVIPPVEEKPVEKPKEENKLECKHDQQFNIESQGTMNQQEGSLQNTIVNIEERLVLAVLNKVAKNQFEEQSDIVSAQDRKEAEQELAAALLIFFGVVMPLYAQSVLAKRANEFGLFADFKLNAEVKKFIKENAGKASESHINTILDDLLGTINTTYEKAIQTEVAKLLAAEASKLSADEATKLLGKSVGKNSEIYKLAAKKALEGAGQQEIINAIKAEYKEISTERAKVIAKTESNRAFTMSQYEADKQFIKQNDLDGKAYKKWRTRSANPCAFCQAKAAEPAIPFEQAFNDIGDEVSAEFNLADGSPVVRKMAVKYETVWAGNLHVQCVLPDTEILAPDTKEIIRSHYSGDIIKITTKHGRGLSVTPNHVVLTARGWVAAKNLLKTDSIISYRNWDEIKASNIDPTNHDSPSTVEQIFATATKSGRATTTTVPVSTKDLKGDAAFGDGKVDIVSPNGLLWSEVDSSLTKRLSDFNLKMAHPSLGTSLISEGNLSSPLFGLSLASDSVMSGESVLESLLSGHITSSDFLRLSDTSTYQTRLKQTIFDNGAGNTELDSELLLRLSSLITSDHITDIERSSYSGHVFDLSTISTLYIANGLITSNCQCIYQLIIM